jgi:hypothetical protein
MQHVSPPGRPSAAQLAELRGQYDRRGRGLRWLRRWASSSEGERSLLTDPRPDDPASVALQDQRWRRTIQVLDGLVILLAFGLLLSLWLTGH